MDTAMRHRVNAGRVAIEDQLSFFTKQFGDVSSQWKEDDTRVTFADFAISEKIFIELRRSFPEDNYCSEESNPLDEVVPLSSRYTWVLDPIDGTNNYALGIPFCAISLALLKDGLPAYGFVYDFAKQVIWEGGPGYGVFAGRRRWTPKEREYSEREGVVGMHFPLPAARYAELEPLLTHFRARSFGSAALNLTYSALGILDGCIDFKVKIWDIAAGVALLQGVGKNCLFLGPDGSPFPLREFHADAPNLPLCAGSQSFLAVVRPLLKDIGS